ncbi:MAG: hypothetical protein LWX52_10225, partial [Deltaproteobacteria bacterium]|nr:hypothetical protein [Deltaproteobacteria bacterium]
MVARCRPRIDRGCKIRQRLNGIAVLVLGAKAAFVEGAAALARDDLRSDVLPVPKYTVTLTPACSPGSIQDHRSKLV